MSRCDSVRKHRWQCHKTKVLRSRRTSRSNQIFLQYLPHSEDVPWQKHPHTDTFRRGLCNHGRPEGDMLWSMGVGDAWVVTTGDITASDTHRVAPVRKQIVSCPWIVLVARQQSEASTARR